MPSANGETTRQELADTDLVADECEIVIEDGWPYIPVTDPDAVAEAVEDLAVECLPLGGEHAEKGGRNDRDESEQPVQGVRSQWRCGANSRSFPQVGIFRVRLDKLPTNLNAKTYREMADQTEGVNSADIAGIVDDAATRATERDADALTLEDLRMSVPDQPDQQS